MQALNELTSGKDLRSQNHQITGWSGLQGLRRSPTQSRVNYGVRSCHWRLYSVLPGKPSKTETAQTTLLVAYVPLLDRPMLILQMSSKTQITTLSSIPKILQKPMVMKQMNDFRVFKAVWSVSLQINQISSSSFPLTLKRLSSLDHRKHLDHLSLFQHKLNSSVQKGSNYCNISSYHQTNSRKQRGL